MKPKAKKTARRTPPMALPLRVGLFALMFLAVVMMGARLRDIVLQIAHGETPAAFAPLKAAEAEAKLDTKSDTKTDAAKIDAPKADASKPTEAKAEAVAAAPADKPALDAGATKLDDKKPADAVAVAAPATEAAKPAATPDVEDPSLDAPDLSEAEINVLKHLSDRRKELDKKAATLNQRETLLSVTEQRVDKKIADLKQMQEDIRKVLGEQDAAHKTQVASMVKIYETMKAKDAAHIFESMDTPTVVEVVSRMKEAKAAPVLAAMDANKAKEISVALIAKKNLPATP